MMLNRITLLSIALLLSVSVQAQFKDAFGKLKKEAGKVMGTDALSQDEAGNGLKEALNIGIDEAVSFLAAENGYLESPYKILVPEEARKVTDKLRGVPGFADVEQKLILKMNRAAELAVERSKPIFVSAIKQMTFQDALNILMGEKDAATQYLHRTTNEALFAEFNPIIQQTLDEVNAREYWRGAVTAYNRIPFVDKTDPELDAYVTNKALEGLFSLVEKKEADIRENPALRTSDLLKKVFGKQDKK